MLLFFPSTVFEHVRNNTHLQKYFEVKMSASFQEGQTLTWDFANYPTFELHTHQIIENGLIKFKWGATHVVFNFSAPNENTTTVHIHTTGYENTQKGLNSAFSECSGWTEFLSSLKIYSEKK